MNYLLDNNLPPALAKAIQELSMAEWNGKHTVVHLRDKFPANTPDSDWITDLSHHADRWVIVTHDNLNKGLEREVLRRAGLLVFMLNKSWSSHTFWDKAYQLVRWWPAIVDQSERITGGAAFSLGWNFSGKGKFELLRI